MNAAPEAPPKTSPSLRLADGSPVGKFGVVAPPKEPEKPFSWRDKCPQRLRDLLRYQPPAIHDRIRRLYEHPCCGADGVFNAYNAGHLDPGVYPDDLCEILRIPFKGKAMSDISLFECFDGWRYWYHINRWLAHRSPKPIQPGDYHNTVGGTTSIAFIEYKEVLPTRAACIETIKEAALHFLTRWNQTVLDHPDTKEIAAIITSWNP